MPSWQSINLHKTPPMKKGRKAIDRDISTGQGSYSLNERPDGMDYDTYKLLRKMQKKLLTLYLKDPRIFAEETLKLKKQIDGFTKKD